MVPWSAKVSGAKLSDTIGTRVRCQNLAPRGGLKFGTIWNLKLDR